MVRRGTDTLTPFRGTQRPARLNRGGERPYVSVPESKNYPKIFSHGCVKDNITMFIHLISIHKFKTNATIQKVNTDLSVKHIFRGNSEAFVSHFQQIFHALSGLAQNRPSLCWRLPSALPPVRGQKAVLRSHRADMAGHALGCAVALCDVVPALLYVHPSWASSAWVSASMVVRSPLRVSQNHPTPHPAALPAEQDGFQGLIWPVANRAR